MLARPGLVATFRLDRPAAPSGVLRGATLVGGPYRGRYFVQRGPTLEALRWNGDNPELTRLWSAPPRFSIAVAGLGDILYAAASDTVVAIDLASKTELSSYNFSCPKLTAVAQADAVDVLVCPSAVGDRATMFAVPRLRARSALRSG